MPDPEDSVQSNSGFVGRGFSQSCAGKVYLVGAGPGDPRLITVRGQQCLQMADYVLFDGLANLALLEQAPRAQKICVGKHGKDPIWHQSTINSRMVELAREGKRVVRLKGGDPAVFGRTAEELTALHEQGIAFEVVPGITAALAVASYAGIPLTHRDHASAVALITGQQQDQPPCDIDWQALARFPGTLVVYMGVTTVRQWTSQLIRAGKSGDTPAAIVRRCTWSDQRMIRCRLDEVADHLTPASKMRPPVLVVIGHAASLGLQWNWFEQLPLFGSLVWWPGPVGRAEVVHETLMALGAQVVIQSVIQLRPPVDCSQLQVAIAKLLRRELHGITFSSRNGVSGFFDYLLSQQKDARLLAGVKLAVVGPSVAQQLKNYGLQADMIPDRQYSAASLVEYLGNEVQGQNWLVTTTNRSGDSLERGLQAAGAQVTNCLTYESVTQLQPAPALVSALSNGIAQYVLVTSGAIAEGVDLILKQLPSDAAAKLQPVAMGQQAATVLQQLGRPAVAVSQSNSIDSLVEALIGYHQGKDMRN